MEGFNSDVKDIKIKWDPDPGRPYFPGEVVSGKAIFVTEKDDVKIQKATIKFIGLISINLEVVRFAFIM